MAKLRVHELARELGRENKEVIEFLKAQGVDIKSHMSSVDEKFCDLAKKRFENTGKGQKEKVENPNTEENKGAENAAPKKKKNIIRVFHAQNASDGRRGPRREKRQPERRPA